MQGTELRDGEITLTTMCLRLGKGTMTGRDMVLRGEVRGRQASNRRWYVEEASVREYESRIGKAPSHRAAA